MARTVLLATWDDGLFVVSGEDRHHELAGQPVHALATDGHGGTLAIVSGDSLRRRTSDGEWQTLATSEFQLACCAPVADVIYVGTDDARVLRVSGDGSVEQLRGFETVDGSRHLVCGLGHHRRSARRTTTRRFARWQPRRTGGCSSRTFTLEVSHARPTAVRPGTPRSISTLTSTRCARTNPIRILSSRRPASGSVSVKTAEQPGASSRTASMPATARPWRSWVTTCSWRHPRTTLRRGAQSIDDQ